MIWGPSSLPAATRHIFLSHSSEDKGWLLDPLDVALRAAGVMPWYDRRHFPLANDGFEALRNGIAECQHVVYLITQATLENRRGWQLLERCFASQVQSLFRAGGNELVRLELPLIFLPNKSASRDALGQSIWQPLLARSLFCPESDAVASVNWAAGHVVRFLLQEQDRGDAQAKAYRQDPLYRKAVDAVESSVRGAKKRALRVPAAFRLKPPD